MTERMKKVNEVLKEEISRAILREIELPSNVLTTVMMVKTSKDLHACKAFISVIPQTTTKEVLSILNRNSHHLHQVLNKKMFIKRVPKMEFLEEKELDEAQHVDNALLKAGKREKELNIEN